MLIFIFIILLYQKIALLAIYSPLNALAKIDWLY